MTLEEQQAHYAAVRRRIASAAPRQVKRAVLPPPVKDSYVPSHAEPFTFPVPCPLRFQRLVRDVCRAYGRDVSLAFTRRRLAGLSKMKFEIYYHTTRAGFGYAAVGRWMTVDHSSVLHGAKRMAAMVAAEEYELQFTPKEDAATSFSNPAEE